MKAVIPRKPTAPTTESDKDKTFKRLSQGHIKPNVSILLLLAAALGGFILTLVSSKSTGGPVIVLDVCVTLFLLSFSVSLKYQFDFNTPTEYEAINFFSGLVTKLVFG
jgi:hypothetical protein